MNSLKKFVYIKKMKFSPNIIHFVYSLELTQGDDLAKLMLLKSPSSEVWFDRRTNFTRSLAVMSMVGYVLGLGDRHPSNLLLDRMSGKILHIGESFFTANQKYARYGLMLPRGERERALCVKKRERVNSNST